MIRVSYRFFLPGALLLACSALTLNASVITSTLGSATPNFTDGQTGIGTATFNAAVAGNAAPFNGFLGSDVNGPNFSATWTYGYGPISLPTISSATLTIGIYDADSVATGNQVASFLLSGVDLTSLLNTAFEAQQGASGGYNIYTITLPSSTFSALASGAPSFSLSLQNGQGILGGTPFNGAGLDFSTLAITAGTTTNTPEPATWLMLGAGLGAMVIGRRLRRG
jgi:hypothetical protein